jgi:uncharacterized protein involved in outer membrane biogenesis
MDGIFHAVAAWAENVLAGLNSRRWLRRTVATVLGILILYGLAGFFGAPYVLRRILTGQVATALTRPVTVGTIAFNPFRLKLKVSDLHVADRDPQQRFIDLKHLRVKVSWSSLWRLAPVVGKFYTDGLAVHIVRIGDHTYNFSDLLEKQKNAPPPPTPSKPQRFAVSNIQLNDGQIDYDDQILHQEHHVQHIRLTVPFIANLPADVNIFVKPFLQMIVDGSHFQLVGYTKPFGKTLDTIVDLNLHRLVLAPYLAYVPKKAPIKLTDGMLSALIHLHFRSVNDQPQIKLDGGAALEKADLRDATGAPLLSLGRAVVTLDDLRPLESVAHLKRIYLEGVNAHLTRNANGTTNLTALTATAAPTASNSPPIAIPTPSATTTVSPTPTRPRAAPPLAAQMQLATPSSTPIPQNSSVAHKSPLDFALGTFEMATSAVEVTDLSQAAPALLVVNGIQARLDGLHTVGVGLAPFEFNANLASGGAIEVKGKLDLANQNATTDATLNRINLPGLKAFAEPFLDGDLAAGKLAAHATLRTSC